MIDFSALKYQSKDNMLSIIRYLVGTGKIEGDDYIALNPTRNDAKPGSFRINIITGKFHDYATGEGGGNIIDLAMYIWKSSAKEAAEKLIQTFPFLASSSDKTEPLAKKEEKSGYEYIWNQSKKEAHAYLDKKKITIGNARVNNYKGEKSLVIPLVNTIPTSEKDLQIKGFQYIKEDGQKQFQRGESTKGLFHIASDYGVPRDKIVVAEGYATARSIATATGLYTVAAMSAGNIEVVTKKVHELTHSQVIIAADNDEPGINFAKKAAHLVKGTKIVYPTKKGDDFNDMYLLEGAEAVKNIFDNCNKQETNDDTEVASEFKIEKNGLFYRDEKVCDYIEVVGLIKKYEGNFWKTKIRFKDMDEVEKEIDVDNKKIRNIVDLVDDLISAGFSPGIDNKLLKNYILQALNNRNDLKRYIEVDKTGWIADSDSYICPSFSCTKNKDNQFILSNNLQDMGYSQQGTLAEWQQNVANLCQNNSLLTFAVCVAFAPVLLKFFPNIGTTVFHIVGGSSIGKTTTSKVVASVWGDPKKFIGQWRTTSNAQEEVAEKHRDSILVLDEIGQANGRDMKNMIYMLGNEQGKRRMNTDITVRPQKTWRTFVFSTGEQKINEVIENAGEKVYKGVSARGINIEADAGVGLGVFKDIHQSKDGSEFSKLLTTNTTKYHGVAAEEFIKKVIDTTEDTIQGIYDKSLERIKDSSGIRATDGYISRLLNIFALVNTAGILASSDYYGILPHNCTAIDEDIDNIIQRVMENTKTQLEENEDVVEEFKDWLKENEGHFTSAWFESDNRITYQGIIYNLSHYGYMVIKRSTYFIIPNKFKMFCKDKMIGESMLKKILRNKKILKETKEEKPRNPKIVVKNEPPKRYVRIQLEPEQS